MLPAQRPDLLQRREVLDAYRRGETEALTEIYNHYVGAVETLLIHGFHFVSDGRHCRYRGVSGQFDLEDQIHEVFARAFSERARSGYDGLTPFRKYLFTIARNLVIDEFRRKSRALEDFVLDAPAERDGSRSSPPEMPDVKATSSDDRLADRQLVRLVAEARASLAPREQQVYELRYERELNHRDIAAETGLSASQIKTSEARIRRIVFQHLRKHGYFSNYQLGPQGWLRALRKAQ